jgi:hypothetical protein
VSTVGCCKESVHGSIVMERGARSHRGKP